MIYYCNFRLRNVHNLSRTNSIDNAAKILGVSTYILKRFLARFSITDKNDVVHILNYGYLYLLNDLPPSLPFHGPYNELNGGVIHNFAEMSLRQVHQIFQLSDTIEDCANALHIKISTLQKWLQNISESNNTAPLTFDSFHEMTEDYAQQLYRKEYDDVVKMPTFTIANKTLHQVHKALIILDSLSRVAEKLNISTEDLQNFLSSFTDSENNVARSFSLQNMGFEEAKALFEEQYGMNEQSAASQNDELFTDLSKITVQDIHKIARKFQLGYASKIIGIEEGALKRFLARISFTNSDNCPELLSFESLRNMSRKDAQELLGGEYTKPNPGRAAVLENFTLRQFHQLLISSSVKMLSIQFNTPGTALRRIIISLLDNPPVQVKKSFNLIVLKNTSIQEASKLFGNNYDKYINSNNVRYRSVSTKLSQASFFNQNKEQKNEAVGTSSANNKKIKIGTNDHDLDDISNLPDQNISNCNNEFNSNDNDFDKYDFDNDVNSKNNDFDVYNLNNYSFDNDEDNDEYVNSYLKNSL